MANNKILIQTSAKQVTMGDGTSVEQKIYNHTHTKSQITDMPTALKNPNALTINGTNYDGSSAVSMSLAVSSHTHPYAGSSTAGGAANSANKVNKSLSISLNGGDEENSNLFTFDGSTGKSINITPESINAATEEHTHVVSNITDFPTSLKNPNALTISLNGTSQGAYDGSAAKSINITPASIGAAVSAHTHNYAGSSSAGGAANSANKVNKSLIVSLNGGDTEGTNLFTFDGSTVKSIDITPESINASVEGHTHTKSEITDFPTSLKNPTALTINGVTYDGSEAKIFTLATSTHTHNYAGSSSAGGVATSAAKVTNSLIVKLNSGTTEGTNMFTFNGSAAKTVNITPAGIGAALSSHTHNYAGSSSAGGAANSANKVNKSLIVSLNGGDTEGTNLFTFDGSTAKNIDITPESINASVEGHTHTKSEITDFPTSLKNPNALTINGTTYDGSAAKTFSLATASHTHNYAGSSSAGGAANSVANSLTINGTSYNGSKAISLDLAEAEHTHVISELTDMPTSLKNPNALTINGTTYDGSAAKTFSLATSDHTHSYAGSSSAGGAATSANKVNSSLIVKLNGGTTEGSNMFTFNGSAAKTVNITPALIGASVSSHTHPYAGSSSAGGAANSVANSLTINGTSYNGSAAKTVNITTDSIGAAEAEHTHTEADIEGTISASKISGVLSLDNIPKGALERVVTVENDTARYALTSSSIQLGDTVKVTDTGLMYIVINESKLSSADGYMEYTAGSASSVPWSGVTGKPTTMKNPYALTINGTAYDGSAAKTFSLALATHTHNYAGSSSAGGVATSAAKVTNALTISLNGTSQGAYDGSAAKSINITPASIGASATSHTHNYAGSSLAGGAANSVANALTINSTKFDGSEAVSLSLATASHTHSYAGSSSAGGAATSANKVNSSLIVKLNSGTTEGTNMFTFNGSAAKTVNITPAGIGAALSSHTHNYAGSSSAGGAANSVKASLAISLNGGEEEDTDLFTFNGSTAKSIDITPESIGASATSHTHNYAGSSSAGGVATSAAKVTNALTINGTTYDGSAAKTFNLATSSHTHPYAGSSSAGGAANSANKVNTNLIIKLNSGATEGTNLFTFNGSAAKTVNITPASIGLSIVSEADLLASLKTIWS